jgi:hypothetical protein
MMNAMPGRGALGALRGSKFGAGRAPSAGFGAFPPMGAAMGQSPQGAMPMPGRGIPTGPMPMPGQGGGMAPQGGMPSPGMQQQQPGLPPMGAAASGMSLAGQGAMPAPGQGQQMDPMVLRSLAAAMAGAGR